MGITWRVTMPLLSTLAALVIIVHSAEDSDQDYRYDLRPKALDTRPSSYEQPWRVVEPMRESELSRTWNNEQEESPIRRRPGRKRKRRPQSDFTVDAQESKYSNMQEVPPISYDNHDQETTEIPRRRRKKLSILPSRWIDEPRGLDVPLRRRLHRKKRPSLDTWPDLSEFGEFVREPNSEEENSREVIKSDLRTEDRGFIYKGIDDDDEYVDKEINVRLSRPKPKITIADTEELPKELTKEDKSLSEFSLEIMIPKDNKNDDTHSYVPYIESKVRDKSPKVIYELEKAQDSGPIDPQTLKAILKRSNGTSLSEILQQHNLTLADLLSKKENAIALLKSEKSFGMLNRNKSLDENISDNTLRKELPNKFVERLPAQNSKEKNGNHSEKDSIVSIIEDNNKTSTIKETTLSDTNEKNTTDKETDLNDDILNNVNNSESLSIHQQNNSTILEEESPSTGMLVKRRFPGAIRRKLRMRPTVNYFKSQLNRDIIALSPRRYVHHNRRNSTKAKEWKDMIPLMPNVNSTRDKKELNEETTTVITSTPEEATTLTSENETTSTLISEDTVISDVINETVTSNTDMLESTTIQIEIADTELYLNMTEQPIIIPSVRPAVNQTGLQRQAYNNRLKRKRLKHKTSTTESPPDDIIRNMLNVGNFVSSSEFIAQTQVPKFTSTDDFKETATELEDFMTTESMRQPNNEHRTKKPHTHKTISKLSTVTKYPFTITTEETAKFEIQEILNDTRISTKLSSILRERNMTLRELLDHRERGSSHVHLADIFHNASREPNPPEPFLSKSLLEPISKETYPLRALLEANSHENAKAATVDSDALLTNQVSIPVIMDFGNNVNEKADNMGIISLFNNITKDSEHAERIPIQQDSEGTPYQSTVISVNATNDDNDARESRMLDNDDQEDLVNWNEIFAMIRKHHKNDSTSLAEVPRETEDNNNLKDDIDGDRLIVLEDLQHLRDLDSMIASKSEENVEFNSYESDLHEESIQNKITSSTKSVTIATASIVGLAMVLFLLTYAALKWKQQRALNQKHGYREERIPSPVFENRKVKKNCSSRSISPMLASSNIYTMSTLDSQNGKDSPEYMWDTLRKPFQ